MKRVFHFSGGQTSGMMVIENYQPNDLVIFCDTGREHPKTYKFINDFEAFENIPVIRLMYEGGFERLLEKRQAIPNMHKRFCTLELKKRTARRYLRSIGWKDYIQFIGFRADEELRVRKYRHEWKTVDTKFPLFEKGVSKDMVNAYWSQKPYRLEIPSILGNCTLCFNKGVNAIIAILAKEPELADVWIADEERNKKGHKYFHGTSISQLRSIAQNNLFKDFDLNEIYPAFNCACTS